MEHLWQSADAGLSASYCPRVSHLRLPRFSGLKRGGNVWRPRPYRRRGGRDILYAAANLAIDILYNTMVDGMVENDNVDFKSWLAANAGVLGPLIDWEGAQLETEDV